MYKFSGIGQVANVIFRALLIVIYMLDFLQKAFPWI